MNIRLINTKRFVLGVVASAIAVTCGTWFYAFLIGKLFQ
jgi:hypothetical protein